MSKPAEHGAAVAIGDGTVTPRIVAAPNLVSAIDFYWHALADLQNGLEDVVGADGRLDYLGALRWKLLAVLQAMDAALRGGPNPIGSAHRAAHALQYGLPGLGLSGPDLAERLKLDDPDVAFESLSTAVIGLGQEILRALPGQIPAAQGNTGQREVLGAMRLWSKAAQINGEDIGFLGARLGEL